MSYIIVGQKKTRRFNPWAPLAWVMDNIVNLFLAVSLILSIPSVIIFAIAPEDNSLAMSLSTVGILMGGVSLTISAFRLMDWVDDGGWDRMVKALYEKSDNYGKIED